MHRPGPSRSKLAIAAAALTVVSVGTTALVVGSLNSNSGNPIATSAESSGNGASSGNTNNAGGSGSGSSGSSSGGLSTTAIAAAVDKGVVDITTNLGYQNASAAGTGMVLTSNGEVLTNNHVVKGATTIKVTVVTTGKSYDAKVVGYRPFRRRRRDPDAGRLGAVHDPAR